MDERKLLGQRIKSLRRVRGYTQEQLAEAIDINPKYLSSVERGEENPTLDLFLRLAQGLKVDLYEIFQFEHEGETPRRLRKKLENLVAAAKDEDLARLTRVLEALVD
ncbi:MAG TPA: helix-turn-helix transcriptional regulator [Candidatus Binatia bacterium]|jgi:transcriptional regulator with XRE-family HTH domain|nr:helix-turn-helix transcriptional regulator [Candidatus Binatia bacterium]